MQHATFITLRAAALRGAGTDPVPSPPSAGAPEPPRRGLARALQSAAALAFVALAGLVSTTSSTGCGGTDTPFCDGGFVRKAPTDDDPGVCEGKCKVEACGENNACSDNHCVLTCTSHGDCTPLAQECVTGKVEDDTKKTLSTCETNSRSTIGVRCAFGNECTGDFKCPDGTTPCDPKNTSGTPCAQADCNSPFPPAYACRDGKACDPKCTGDACPCAPADCNPLFCRTSGQGDAEAFCTLRDCHGDSECPGGYWCATVRDSHEICGSSPQKGDNNFCGTTTEPCVDPSMSAANGTTFAEGPYCALRNECRVRRQCAPCETDLDCSAVAGQHCKMVGAAKACVRDCIGESDCEQGFACTDGSCVPRSGTCVGDGTYCSTCRNDNDCGGPSSKFACVSFGGAERMCLDVSASQACTADADCPTGPDGRHGLCADEDLGLTPTDSLYHKCYLPPFNKESNKFSCWGANAGAACSAAKDCISGKCQSFAPGMPVCCVPSGTGCRADTECCSKHCNGADVVTGTLGACQ